VVALALACAAALIAVVSLASPAQAASRPATPPATGWVRLGHFAPAQTPVDLRMDGKVVAENISFRNVSPYVSVPAGPHQFAVLSTGADPQAKPLLEVRAGVDASQAVTVAAIAAREGLAGQVFEDRLMPPPPGKALVRFIHASPDVPAVDISVIDGSTLATGVAYPQASPYVAVAAGTYDLKITQAGSKAEVLRVSQWKAPAGSQSTVVVVRGLDGQPDVVPVADSGGAAATPAGGLATGFGGLATNGPVHENGPQGLATSWLASGALTLLVASWALTMRRSRNRVHGSAALLAFTGAVGLGLVGCAQRDHSAADHAGGATSGTPVDGAAISATTVDPVDRTVDDRAAERSREVGAPAPVRSGANVNSTPSVGEPTAITIASIGVQSELVPLGLAQDGTAEVPEDPQIAGWFTGGPRPGDEGPAVIAGHVDTQTGPAVFAQLKQLAPGDEVDVSTTTGTVRFIVDRREQVAKDDFPTARVYGPAPGRQLRLVTCGGSFDRSSGHYRDNVVVWLTQKTT